MHILPLVACNSPPRYACCRYRYSRHPLVRLKETRKGSGTSDLNLPECIGSAPLSVAQRPIELVPGGGDLVDRGLGREGGGRAGQSGGEGKGKLRHGRSSYFLRPTYASKGGTKRNRVCFWIVRMMR